MSRRKVGGVVIMHPNHNNYGTSLQGFATVKFVQRIDYPFRIIRYNKKRTIKEILKTFVGLIRSGAMKEAAFRIYQKLFMKTHKEYARLIAERTEVVNKFKSKYFDAISDFYTGYTNLCEGSKNYDVIFVGSDQVWGPLSLYSRFYNLLFVDKNIPQFSYASSFGVSSIFPWQRKGTAEYLDKMDVIGVREVRGKEIVDELSKRKATVVADPTLLLTKDEWAECIQDSKMQIDEPYILSYTLGPREDIREEIMKFGKQTGLKVVSFRHMDWFEPADENFGDIPVYNADPLDFVKLLSKAEYVCTDSFHGTVFSIIFQKKFTTFYRHKPTSNGSTHSRIDSLLGIMGLEKRLFNGNLKKEIEEEVDYAAVGEKLSKLRQESMDFFKNALEVCKKSEN